MRSKAWRSSADEDTCETCSATPRVSFAGLVYTPVPFNSLHACSAALPDRVPELNLPPGHGHVHFRAVGAHSGEGRTGLLPWTAIVAQAACGDA